MIKTTYICDCCGKELDDPENVKRISIRDFGGTTYRQIDKNMGWNEGDICKDCADKILEMLKEGKTNE